MPLDNAALEQILTRLSERAPNFTCSACGHNEWTMTEGLVILSQNDEPGTIVVGGPTLPNIALVCRTCGHTMLFNLMVLGLGHLVAPEAQP